MNFFELILIWLHLIGATFWVGGMLFLTFVAVPLLKQSSEPVFAQREFVKQARRFRMFVWVALSILIVTGAILLSNLVNLSQSVFNWPPAVLSKLVLVFLLIVVSLGHDRFIGPKIRNLKNKPISELVVTEKFFLRISPLIGRLTMFLGIATLLAAAFMVRA